MNKEEGILIAEFMDLAMQMPLSKLCMVEHPITGEYVYPDQLPYETDWNALMDVWYKFRDLKMQYGLRPLHKHYCAKIAQQMAYGGITNAYKALYWGIQWYNENK